MYMYAYVICMVKFVMEEIKYVICMNLSKCQVGNFPHFPVFQKESAPYNGGEKTQKLGQP